MFLQYYFGRATASDILSQIIVDFGVQIEYVQTVVSDGVLNIEWKTPFSPGLLVWTATEKPTLWTLPEVGNLWTTSKVSSKIWTGNQTRKNWSTKTRNKTWT